MKLESHDGIVTVSFDPLKRDDVETVLQLVQSYRNTSIITKAVAPKKATADFVPATCQQYSDLLLRGRAKAIHDVLSTTQGMQHNQIAELTC